MAFNFQKAVKKAEDKLSQNTVEAIVLGPQGAGKSAACGSFGVKTLYLFFSGEKHGPRSARTHGKSAIDAICLDDAKDDGSPRTPDESYKYALEILDDVEGIKSAGYQAVVLDGIPEAESCIRATQQFKVGCMTSKGEHNTFQEGPVATSMLREITSRLRRLADEGIHYAVTCIVDVAGFGEAGEITDATVRMGTYGCALSLVPQFGDVLLVGRMEKDDKVAHRFQFNATISRASKDVKGNIKKLFNFSPRVNGVEVPPENMKASLAEVIKLKTGGKK